MFLLVIVMNASVYFRTVTTVTLIT